MRAIVWIVMVRIVSMVSLPDGQDWFKDYVLSKNLEEEGEDGLGVEDGELERGKRSKMQCLLLKITAFMQKWVSVLAPGSNQIVSFEGLNFDKFLINILVI